MFMLQQLGYHRNFCLASSTLSLICKWTVSLHSYWKYIDKQIHISRKPTGNCGKHIRSGNNNNIFQTICQRYYYRLRSVIMTSCVPFFGFILRIYIVFIMSWSWRLARNRRCYTRTSARRVVITVARGSIVHMFTLTF